MEPKTITDEFPWSQARNRKILLFMRFEIVGLGRPILYGSLQGYIWSKLGGKKSLTVGCVKLAFHFKRKGWININASYTVHVKESSNENEGKLMIIQDEFP